MQKILIGMAWPSVNGPQHIGHLSGLLPADILARYWRAAGADVTFVSGSDCYGTAIEIRARQQKISPAAVADRYHDEFVMCFGKLGFSFDNYTRTSSEHHRRFVGEFHAEMYRGEYVYEKIVNTARCPICQRVLSDRLMIGVCPSCGETTRGEQCDGCGAMLDAETIIDPRCAECNGGLTFARTTQLFLAVSKLQPALESLMQSRRWRRNAVAFTRRLFGEGLRDRSFTRDFDWGIPVPREGYDGKSIYIWAENVLGYLSAAAEECQRRGTSFDELYGSSARHYYVHGKDNIPFHTIMLPALLLAHGGGWRLPDDIISSEFLTLDGQKISTSKNHAVWVRDIVDKYNPDALRYFFIANGPEKRDADFTWRAFADRINADLVGVYGNFVNRTLAFVRKYYNGILPTGDIDSEVAERSAAAFGDVGKNIADGEFRDAINYALSLARFGNKYYDAQQPWVSRTADPLRCAAAICNCVYLIANLAVLFEPFLPFSSEKVRGWLGIDATWDVKTVEPGRVLPEIEILFERV